MKPEVIILRGLPGSGKSTLARKMCEQDSMKKRVNKDDLRAMVDDGRYSSANERLIEDIRDSIILACLRSGYSVVVDDTNIEGDHIDRIVEIARRADADTSVLDMNVSVKECIRRDALRTGKAHVGEAVIRRMAERM